MKTLLTLSIAIIAFTLTSSFTGRRVSSLPAVQSFRVTAYCPCSRCCGKWADGMTANGHTLRPGDRLVAAPKEYSFGTTMIIPGYNNGRPVQVKDRGGAIKGDRLDVYFDTHQEALVWGVRYLDVEVVR